MHEVLCNSHVHNVHDTILGNHLGKSPMIRNLLRLTNHNVLLLWDMDGDVLV